MLLKSIALILLTFNAPMFQNAAFFGSNYSSSAATCSMPSTGALAEYYASATGAGAPSSCTGAAITSWGDNSGNGINLTAVGSPTCAAESGINGQNAVN